MRIGKNPPLHPSREGNSRPYELIFIISGAAQAAWIAPVKMDGRDAVLRVRLSVGELPRPRKGLNRL